MYHILKTKRFDSFGLIPNQGAEGRIACFNSSVECDHHNRRGRVYEYTLEPIVRAHLIGA